MLQIHSTQRLDQIESGLRIAAERRGGSILAVSNVGQTRDVAEPDAIGFTMCFSDLYAPLMCADTRFAVFLPSRIAACVKGGGVVLEAISPRDYCRLLHRPELEPLAVSLEDTLRAVMEEAGHHAGCETQAGGWRDHRATEEQVNMRATLPQRVDCHGGKVEELAGTGAHDAQGG